MYKSIMVFLLAALVMTSEAQAAGNENPFVKERCQEAGL